MNARLTTLAAVIVVLATACTSVAPAASITPSTSTTSGIELAAATLPRASADPAEALKAAEGMNAFGLDLYHQVATGTGNVVISPASIALALSMARAGARGSTATQMDAVMRAIASDDHAGWMNALEAALTTRTGTFKDRTGKDADVTLRIADASFAQRGLTLVPAYLNALASRFGAGLRLVDFVTDTESARQLINLWTSDQTEHRIPELIGKGVITDLTRLVLVNAIYLKAAWQTPFTVELTKPGSFTKLDGSTVDVPTMAGGGSLPYAAGAGWRAVELPYVGGALAMTLIVPDDFTSFEAKLDGATLTAITSALAVRDVDVTLPKFGIETKADLVKALGALGMSNAFDAQTADFSGITTQERLFISDVIHQANIDVDENGTTAAAATAVVIGDTAAPVDHVSLHIDRPFLFALRDTQTGAVLFLGRVTLPATR